MPQISINRLMNDMTPTYAPEAVQPFRDELTAVGFRDLLTPEDVDAALNRQDDKTVLLVLNSVCGCAAGKARPGVVLSLMNEKVPDECVAVFAGMEKAAVNQLREQYMPGITPSSPNIALFRNGKLIHLLQRYEVEGRSAGDIAQDLTTVYDRECQKENSKEEIEKIENYLLSKYPRRS